MLLIQSALEISRIVAADPRDHLSCRPNAEVIELQEQIYYDLYDEEVYTIGPRQRSVLTHHIQSFLTSDMADFDRHQQDLIALESQQPQHNETNETQELSQNMVQELRLAHQVPVVDAPVREKSMKEKTVSLTNNCEERVEEGQDEKVQEPTQESETIFDTALDLLNSQSVNDEIEKETTLAATDEHKDILILEHDSKYQGYMDIVDRAEKQYMELMESSQAQATAEEGQQDDEVQEPTQETETVFDAAMLNSQPVNDKIEKETILAATDEHKDILNLEHVAKDDGYMDIVDRTKKQYLELMESSQAQVMELKRKFIQENAESQKNLMEREKKRQKHCRILKASILKASVTLNHYLSQFNTPKNNEHLTDC